MNRLQTIVATLVVAALSAAITLNADQPGKIAGKATVRVVKGNVSYSLGGVSLPLKANMNLGAGTMISTGPDSYADITINDGVSSCLRITADTVVVLEKLDLIGAERERDTDTMLDLRVGSILGQVKKVSANSRFEIKTPHGVAGVRGTSLNVTVVQLPDGQFQVTFTCLDGTLVASAVVSGQLDNETLNTGDSWTVGGKVVPMEIQLLQGQMNTINAMIAEIQQGAPPPSAGPVGPLKYVYYYPGYKPGDILPNFPYGGPPGGRPSSAYFPVRPPHHPFDLP
jgi:hypothetical protein